MSLLRLESVSKTYRSNGEEVVAVQDIDFEAEPGAFVALVGRSGCGKSTLLNLCGAMDFPTSGRVLIDGSDTATLGDAGLTRLRRSRVGFVFQFFQLLPTLTAAENVELPLLLSGAADARRRALEVLDWVELSSLAARLPHQLSGGQMQRVAIARALVHSPSILLADEPIGNLDSTTGETILGLLARAARERSAAVLMATHSAESTGHCNSIVRLRDGRIESVTENTPGPSTLLSR